MRLIVENSPNVDQQILKYKDNALTVWDSSMKILLAKEKFFEVPFTINENPRLYAIDALALASPLTADKEKIDLVSNVFVLFYLIVHLYDDYVEDPLKFYSKFDLSPKINLDLQRNAVPFSFLILTLSAITQELESSTTLSNQAKLNILSLIQANLAEQAKYFAQEHKENPTIDEALSIKRHVAGISLYVIADILNGLGLVKDSDLGDFKQGLYCLGTLSQITDDIRDYETDSKLGNTNIVKACVDNRGTVRGIDEVSKIFDSYLKKTKEKLSVVYNEEEIMLIISLPFYPFMIDKNSLKLEQK